MTVKTSLGAQTKKYRPPQKLLRDEDRTVTDGCYRILFCIISTIWLASCICALYCSAHGKSSLPNATILENIRDQNSTITKNVADKNSTNTKNITNHHFAITENITHDHSTIANNITHHNSTAKNEITASIIGWIKRLFLFCVDIESCNQERVSSVYFWVSIIIYSSLILLAMKIMHHWAAMSPPALVVMSSTMIIISIIYHIVQYFINDTNRLEPLYKKFLYWVGPEAVLLLLSIFTFFNIMRYTGVSVMRDLLKKAFRFYVNCRYLLIVGFLITAMILVLNIFTSKVLKTVSFNSVESKIIYSIIYGGSWYLILVIHALGRMVISAAAAGYYWNENDEQSFFKVMCQKIVSVSKYHFGSACCKATFTSLWFIPVVVGLIGFEFEFYETAVGYCLIFDLLQILAFDNTVFLIGMYGVSASEASDLFFYIFKKISKFIAMTFQGLWSATFIILLPTNCIMLILMLGLDQNNALFSFVSSRSYVEIIVVSLPITFVLGTIEDARSMCIMKDMAEQKELEEEKSLEEPTEVMISSDSDVDSEKN